MTTLKLQLRDDACKYCLTTFQRSDFKITEKRVIKDKRKNLFGWLIVSFDVKCSRCDKTFDGKNFIRDYLNLDKTINKKYENLKVT